METKPFQSNRSSYPTSSTRKQTILSLVVLPCLSTPNASSAQSQNHCEELSHLFLRSSAPQAIIDTMSLTCDSENSTNVVGTTNSRPRTTASNGGCNNKHMSFQHKGGHYKECTSTVLLATTREEIDIFMKRQNECISKRKEGYLTTKI